MPAWRVEIEKFFSLIVFNYLFSNGDEHLKNFALLETSSGDHFLSPAYDLINTRVHVADTDFGLNKGLFADEFRSPVFKRFHHPAKEDFMVFAQRTGIDANRAQKLLAPFLEKRDKVLALTSRSFLNDSAKKAFWPGYNSRRNMLNREL